MRHGAAALAPDTRDAPARGGGGGGGSGTDARGHRLNRHQPPPEGLQRESESDEPHGGSGRNGHGDVNAGALSHSLLSKLRRMRPPTGMQDAIARAWQGARHGFSALGSGGGGRNLSSSGPRTTTCAGAG